MSKTKRWVRWVGMNGALLCLLLYGMHSGDRWAALLFTTITVVATVGAMFVWMVMGVALLAKAHKEAGSPDPESKVPEMLASLSLTYDKVKIVPRWLDLSYDLIIVVLLAVADWPVTFILYVVMVAVQQRLWTNLKVLQKEHHDRIMEAVLS